MASSGAEEAGEFERERRGDVCVPAERWKKRAASELSESVSGASAVGGGGGSGTWETAVSSLAFKASRLARALSDRECRAAVRLESIGSRMDLLVP